MSPFHFAVVAAFYFSLYILAYQAAVLKKARHASILKSNSIVHKKNEKDRTNEAIDNDPLNNNNRKIGINSNVKRL